MAEPRDDGLDWRAPVAVLTVLLVVAGIGFALQSWAEHDAVHTAPTARGAKDQREIDKLTAEVRQIRSDTTGSLFWLKLAAVFVTVGGAVGSYLVAQGRANRDRQRAADDRLEFDQRKQVDGAFQDMVKELASESPLLRTAAAMKLGRLIYEPPVEWSLTPQRSDELRALTKQILAASLAIEADPKVRKALTAAIALRQPEQSGDLRRIDFSRAKATDAYWADVDFSGADFYGAELEYASFRRATLTHAQFREARLSGAVLVAATCVGTNFKLADLRGVDLSDADLSGATFDGAKVHGTVLTAARHDGPAGDAVVDLSPEGDASRLVTVADWLAGTGA